MNWERYWGEELKVNEAVMRLWAEEFYRKCCKSVGFNGEDVVLDFGAGTGDIAIAFSGRVGWVLAYDRSEKMRETLREKLTGDNVEILNGLEDLSKKPNRIIINSVIQYLSPEQLEHTLKAITEISAEQSIMVIADVIPDDYSKLIDTIQLLRVAYSRGFLGILLSHIFCEIVSHPRMTLSPKSLNKYKKNELQADLKRLGWQTKIVENFTFSSCRYTVVADKA